MFEENKTSKKYYKKEEVALFLIINYCSMYPLEAASMSP